MAMPRPFAACARPAAAIALGFLLLDGRPAWAQG